MSIFLILFIQFSALMAPRKGSSPTIYIALQTPHHARSHISSFITQHPTIQSRLQLSHSLCTPTFIVLQLHNSLFYTCISPWYLCLISLSLLSTTDFTASLHQIIIHASPLTPPPCNSVSVCISIYTYNSHTVMLLSSITHCMTTLTVSSLTHSCFSFIGLVSAPHLDNTPHLLHNLLNLLNR